MITIKKGLDLPITGEPTQTLSEGNSVKSVALVGYDYHGMKPTMLVREGDRVKLGQPVFTDKKTEGVTYTAPGTGVVKAINRGKRRVFQSLVIELDGDEEETFDKYTPGKLGSLSRDKIVDNLVRSGVWTVLRTRPFSKVPAPDSTPAAIFVNAMDTNPLAADPAVIIAEEKEAFQQGLTLISKLTEGRTWLCKAPGADIPVVDGVSVEEFAGPHPAGNVGTHIHFLDPVHLNKTVWTINYQDVIAIARLFTTGRISTDRVIALGGPMAEKPRLIRTRIGANLFDLCQGEVPAGENVRMISGSVWGGRAPIDEVAYLGRYHLQVSLLREGTDRPMFHYLRPGFERFSVLNIYVSRLFKGKKFDFDTSTQGSERAMLPLGQYEKVMPLDILPTQLLRAIASGDLEQAEELGALELDEEDVALLSYVCAGKYEYGPILRDTLTTIEKEG
ncbi:Na(+)-translocating NADH-quinone reductase subunit A [Natronospirillum operosum]|uniref:Na(+)-translocating NADH-quinone reductase subunit A n=1 Tax=Natronospirillum operosum TaxID=2759953 RepID=A0A4Z0WDG7_9GAMM|nr:Na(+)-translocating NADH-quinone reductase subunit A [Natronospirillum operosum]TGG95914.1 Na(+)-translocating NADH-quinone reductase subunit A [Natronospirillum operosum]